MLVIVPITLICARRGLRCHAPVGTANGGYRAAMVTGPGDELAASAADRRYRRVSHAEREQVIGTVKAAFVPSRRPAACWRTCARPNSASPAVTGLRSESGMLRKTAGDLSRDVNRALDAA